MVTPLASRFAVLPIDDDGDTSKRITAKSLNKKRQEQTKSQPVSVVTKFDGSTKKKQIAKKKSDQVSLTT